MGKIVVRILAGFGIWLFVAPTLTPAAANPTMPPDTTYTPPATTYTPPDTTYTPPDDDDDARPPKDGGDHTPKAPKAPDPDPPGQSFVPALPGVAPPAPSGGGRPVGPGPGDPFVPPAANPCDLTAAPAVAGRAATRIVLQVPDGTPGCPTAVASASPGPSPPSPADAAPAASGAKPKGKSWSWTSIAKVTVGVALLAGAAYLLAPAVAGTTIVVGVKGITVNLVTNPISWLRAGWAASLGAQGAQKVHQGITDPGPDPAAAQTPPAPPPGKDVQTRFGGAGPEAGNP